VNKLFLVFNEHLDALQHGVDGIADTALFKLAPLKPAVASIRPDFHAD